MLTAEQIGQLREARALIDRGWCQGFTALDAGGRVTPVRAPTAAAWCAMGAILAVDIRRDFFDGAFDLLDATVGGDVVEWNNAPVRTQAEVLAAFDAAIATAEAAQC